MKVLLDLSDSLIAKTNGGFKRFLYERINWNERLIGIKGPRGTGKTTLLLQKLNELGLPPHKAAYFTLDHLYFVNNNLFELARSFYHQGGECMALDEVHKYPGWAREIKNIYDLLPDLQVIFTGSSIIDISQQEADLSRRSLMYELPGLSYREFLHFFHGIELPVIPLNDILSRETSLRRSFPEDLRPLEHFRAYLEAGYYPFFKGLADDHHQRLQQLTRTIVEYDMAELKGFDIRNAKKMLQLIGIIAQQVPFQPNLSDLAEKSRIHRNSMNNYILFLEKARLVRLLYPAGGSTATLQKPEKIYLDNPNLNFALASHPSAGTLRETFFLAQLKVDHEVSVPKKGDFLVDKKWGFEVGGKNKSNEQIRSEPDFFLVKDDIGFPAGNALPLWLFGFLY